MRLLSGVDALKALAHSVPPPHPRWPLDCGASLRAWLWDESRRWEQGVLSCSLTAFARSSRLFPSSSQLAALADDAVFRAQRAVGLVELSAGPEYTALKRRRANADAAYQASAGRKAIEASEKQVIGGAKAITNLRAYALGGSEADDEATRAKRSRAVEKLERIADTDAARQAQLDEARAFCSEWRELQTLTQSLEEHQQRLGLPELEQQARTHAHVCMYARMYVCIRDGSAFWE